MTPWFVASPCSRIVNSRRSSQSCGRGAWAGLACELNMLRGEHVQGIQGLLAARARQLLLVKAGVPRYAELVTFADEPGEAAANYYLLKLMGFPDVKVLLM